jgi:hypothetical protein
MPRLFDQEHTSTMPSRPPGLPCGASAPRLAQNSSTPRPATPPWGRQRPRRSTWQSVNRVGGGPPRGDRHRRHARKPARLVQASPVPPRGYPTLGKPLSADSEDADPDAIPDEVAQSPALLAIFIHSHVPARFPAQPVPVRTAQPIANQRGTI